MQASLLLYFVVCKHPAVVVYGVLIDVPDRQSCDFQGPSLLWGITICLLLYVHRDCLFSARNGRRGVFVYVLSMGNIILCKHPAPLSGGVVWMRREASAHVNESGLSAETGWNLQPLRKHKTADVSVTCFVRLTRILNDDQPFSPFIGKVLKPRFWPLTVSFMWLSW